MVGAPNMMPGDAHFAHSGLMRLDECPSSVGVNDFSPYRRQIEVSVLLWEALSCANTEDIWVLGCRV
jgi:hypothetical protein